MENISLINNILNSPLINKEKRLAKIANNHIASLLKIYAADAIDFKKIYDMFKDPRFTSGNEGLINAFDFLMKYKPTWKAGAVPNDGGAAGASEFSKLIHGKSKTVNELMVVFGMAQWFKNNAKVLNVDKIIAASPLLQYFNVGNNCEGTIMALSSMYTFPKTPKKDIEKTNTFMNVILNELVKPDVPKAPAPTPEQYDTIKNAILNSGTFFNQIIANPAMGSIYKKYQSDFKLYGNFLTTIMNDNDFYNLIIQQYPHLLDKPDFISQFVNFAITAQCLVKIAESEKSNASVYNGILNLAGYLVALMNNIIPNWNRIKSFNLLLKIPASYKHSQNTKEFLNNLYKAVSEKFLSAYNQIKEQTEFHNSMEKNYVANILKKVSDEVPNYILAIPNELGPILGAKMDPGQVMYAVVVIDRNELGNVDKENMQECVNIVIQEIEKRGETVKYQDDCFLNKWLKRETLLLASAFFWQIHRGGSRWY